MNVEIETEAKQFPEKEYINGIFSAVRHSIQTVLISRKCSVNSPLCFYYWLVNVLSEGALGDLGKYPGHGVDPVHRIVFHQLDHLQPVRAELPFWTQEVFSSRIYRFLTGVTGSLMPASSGVKGGYDSYPSLTMQLLTGAEQDGNVISHVMTTLSLHRSTVLGRC